MGHDASVTVVDDEQITFAAHAERYSRIKNDPHLNHSLLNDALAGVPPDKIVWYERPTLKRLRMLLSGQPCCYPSLASYLTPFNLTDISVSTVGHHHAHAAAGYYTSPFDEAAILVIDAIGEFDTISLWRGQGTRLTKLWAQYYPHSLGLLYSAFTKRCGLKPNEEEYILMGMAAFGQPCLVEDMRATFLVDDVLPHLTLKCNVHRGIGEWGWWASRFDLAASIQKLTEDYLVHLARWAHFRTGSRNLVLMGGVALNCVANTKIAESDIFQHIWIMPNPGDAGSSLGAIAAWTHRRLDWQTPYLGYDITTVFDYGSALQALRRGEVIGIATGRAEFGPRALGNRSLVCDPRGIDVKDRVNAIKQREEFRPFAPVIKEELAKQYFVMPVKNSPYMQFTAQLLRPDLYPAICHIDGTARVQTLRQDQNAVFYRLLDAFHQTTGCPMLLNTSLNVKGQPLVNSWNDAEQFGRKYEVAIF